MGGERRESRWEGSGHLGDPPETLSSLKLGTGKAPCSLGCEDSGARVKGVPEEAPGTRPSAQLPGKIESWIFPQCITQDVLIVFLF